MSVDIHLQRVTGVGNDGEDNWLVQRQAFRDGLCGPDSTRGTELLEVWVQ